MLPPLLSMRVLIEEGRLCILSNLTKNLHIPEEHHITLCLCIIQAYKAHTYLIQVWVELNWQPQVLWHEAEQGPSMIQGAKHLDLFQSKFRLKMLASIYITIIIKFRLFWILSSWVSVFQEGQSSLLWHRKACLNASKNMPCILEFMNTLRGKYMCNNVCHRKLYIHLTPNKMTLLTNQCCNDYANYF